MKVLITGITGFGGSHLAEYALVQGAEVYGTVRWRSNRANIAHLLGDIALLDCELTDASATVQTILEARPDRIFHLAAQAFVPTSWRAPAGTLTTNVIAALNVFEAVRAWGQNPLILNVGSSEEYGLVQPDEVPITEDVPLRPLSPYAVSKAVQDLLGYQYQRSYGLRIVRTRAFNHSGPRQHEAFVVPAFARQIAEAEAGLREPVIHVGNLESSRDFTDVRDVVRAYWLALEHGVPGEVYNICSGQAHTIQEILDTLLSLSTMPIEMQRDPRRMRPSDVPLVLGDSHKFQVTTGWQPEIPLRQMLGDVLDYWRARMRE
jgi:GDP-4-dehydro-6-deoxy-D-mannose reductase